MSIFLGPIAPVAFYPLTANSSTNETSQDILPAGLVRNVTLSEGPNGSPNGSYYFEGSFDSNIYFQLSKRLEIQDSMTILLSFYPESPGVIISFNTGLEIYVTKQGTIAATIRLRWEPKTYLLETTRTQLSLWKTVAFWYDYYHGVIGLRVDNQTVTHNMICKERPIIVDSNVMLGASFHRNQAFRGRITNLQIYDEALNEEEIERNKDLRPGM